MVIKNYIKKVRDYLLRYTILISCFYFLIIISFFFLLMIQLESIFYFSPDIKRLIALIILSTFITIILFGLIYFRKAKNNKIHRYKIERLANIVGLSIFPAKSDMVINAYQLESGAEKNESQALATSYINNVYKKLEAADLTLFFDKSKLIRLKVLLLLSWLLIIVVFLFNYNYSSNAFYRLINPQKMFPAPKPFYLQSLSGNIHILGGEKTKITVKANPIISDTLFLNLIPIQVSTQKRDSLKLKFHSISNQDGVFDFELPELFQDYSYQAVVNAKYFWEAWESVTTVIDTIFVTDRPIFKSFLLSTIPPEYSKLIKTTHEGNIALVKGLKGSLIQVDITSNRMIENSYIDLNGKSLKMSSNYNKASGYFKLMEEGNFTVNIADRRGITNRDPIAYKLNIIPDYAPNIKIINPSPITELGNNQTIPIDLEISDDYGFTNLQLAYEIHRPSYLGDDPYVVMFNIDNFSVDSLFQKIKMFWDLTDLFLMPDDEVHFHFELTDNDNISGPKKTISETLIIKIPSLIHLYENIEESEENIVEDIVEDLNNIQELREQFNDIEMKMLKSKELNWDQTQSIKNSLNKTKEKIENLDKVAEALESVTEQAEKHKLLSPSLIEKFKELSDLISEIIPSEMLNNIDNLEMALENMDMESLSEALNNLSENMEQVEQDLDRYLEIFKRFQAEQKLNEIQNRIQQLQNQQADLNKNLKNNNADKNDIKRLEQEANRNLEEFENILSLAEEASEIIKEFSNQSSIELSELANSELAESANTSFNQTIENLSEQSLSDATNSSQSALENLELMAQQMSNIQQGFNQQEIEELMEKFQMLLQDMIYLSSQEEQLKEDTKILSRNSPRLREYAQRQQLLQDQLKSITQTMSNLSNETFAITPEIGRSLGKANAGMQEAKSDLTNRNINQASKNQNIAMEGLNETSLGLINSMKNLQESGSASGFEQFLQMMQQMAGKQQGLNEQGMQLSLGQMAAAAQQQMIQQMLDSQREIRKSLEQLMKEMRHSGQKGMGDLNGIAEEMDAVIQDLQRKNFNQKTQDRQQRILSRMLDSQTSMTQRGEKDERKSSTAITEYLFEGPSGLPTDLGQRESLAFQALNQSMKAGYSKEHQRMIKRYFNLLTKISEEKNNED